MADYFERLNYALGDEDTALEFAILPPRARHVVGVAGSGGRLLPQGGDEMRIRDMEVL